MGRSLDTWVGTARLEKSSRPGRGPQTYLKLLQTVNPNSYFLTSRHPAAVATTPATLAVRPSLSFLRVVASHSAALPFLSCPATQPSPSSRAVRRSTSARRSHGRQSRLPFSSGACSCFLRRAAGRRARRAGQSRELRQRLPRPSPQAHLLLPRRRLPSSLPQACLLRCATRGAGLDLLPQARRGAASLP